MRIVAFDLVEFAFSLLGDAARLSRIEAVGNAEFFSHWSCHLRPNIDVSACQNVLRCGCPSRMDSPCRSIAVLPRRRSPVASAPRLDEDVQVVRRLRVVLRCDQNLGFGKHALELVERLVAPLVRLLFRPIPGRRASERVLDPGRLGRASALLVACGSAISYRMRPSGLNRPGTNP